MRRKVSQIEPRLQHQKELGQHCVERKECFTAPWTSNKVCTKQETYRRAWSISEAFDGPGGVESLRKKKKKGGKN